MKELNADDMRIAQELYQVKSTEYNRVRWEYEAARLRVATTHCPYEVGDTITFRRFNSTAGPTQGMVTNIISTHDHEPYPFALMVRPYTEKGHLRKRSIYITPNMLVME